MKCVLHSPILDIAFVVIPTALRMAGKDEQGTSRRREAGGGWEQLREAADPGPQDSHSRREWEQETSRLH